MTDPAGIEAETRWYRVRANWVGLIFLLLLLALIFFGLPGGADAGAPGGCGGG